MAHNESVGLMHPAYFVGRSDLLEWLNSTLYLKLTRVEETANGAVACQIFDLLFPNLVQMGKVNWGASAEWEYVQNYKVLQQACDKIRCTKRIDVDRLIKGRQQDNLEFLQWLKKFFDDNYTASAGENYNPIQRRALGKGRAKWMSSTSPAPPPSSTMLRRATPVKRASAPVASTRIATPAAPILATTTALAPSSSAVEIVELRMKIAGLKQEIQDIALEHENKMRAVEKDLRRAEEESEYYFDKLSKIEALVKSKKNQTNQQLGEEEELIEKLDGILFDDAAAQAE